MHISWNEIRARAARFSTEWKDAHYEKGETQTFYNEFFEVFGVRRRQVATFEEPVKRLGNKRGFIDLFWKGVLLVEQKSAGQDLIKAKEQALDYFPHLREYELPRYILLSDFQSFELYDLDEDHETHFGLSDLPNHVEDFGFILGIQKRSFKDQDPVNIEASELMGRLHDALKASGYTGHELERFLVRLLFCLFADDTGIFEPRGILLELLQNRTNEDGSDTGLWLHSLFEVLNTPEDRRQRTLDEDLARFPYVDGDLFEERLHTPSFNADMRKLLIEACTFSWDAISPAIFGSLFQSVMDKLQRRALGAHYTTEKNILKVIEPLFLDGLRAEFSRLKARRDSRRQRDLLAFQERLGQMRFFDPACGCGNFLIIAYRELRELELEVLKLLYPSGQLRTDARSLSKIDVDQFYGIEIEEFPARIAEVALWMMDHIMNTRLSLMFGLVFTRIPLRASPHIRNADALDMEWSEVIDPKNCSYVFGNPPFGGAKYQTPQQREQVRRIAQLGGTGGTLDYVTAWFLKAGAYVQPQECNAEIAFVATNSVTQGEQVAQLWPLLFQRYALDLNFAHRTFAWGSDARGKAHVHVVILGLSKRIYEWAEKRLFSYDDINGDPIESAHKALSPYLVDASNLRDRHLVVEERGSPLCEAPKMITGSKPIDGGYYIFKTEQKDEFLTNEPKAAEFVHPFVGAEEYINGDVRWILALQDVPPAVLRAMPLVMDRVQNVRRFRLGEVPPFDAANRPPQKRSAVTIALARTPTMYHVNVVPTRDFLVVPQTSSESRTYVPIGWLSPPIIPSDKLRLIYDADPWQFGILTSQMHMAWMRTITGRMKSDYMYSVGVVYNNFPWPEASDEQKARIRKLAQAVLGARAKFPEATLADLYDPDAMPRELWHAHHELDRAVDRLYRRTGFSSDRERVEHLFGLYEKLVAPLTAQQAKTVKRPATRRLRTAPMQTQADPREG